MQVRALASSTIVVPHTFTVDGVPTDADAPVTYTLYAADGSTVSTGTATATGGGSGKYAVTLTLPSQPNVRQLEWSAVIAGGAVKPRDLIEIVGGFIVDLDLAVARLHLKQGQFSWDDLRARRISVEDEAEAIAGVAFVPRFAREAIRGNNTGEITTQAFPVRNVRTVSINGQALDPDQVAQISFTESGILGWLGGWPVPLGGWQSPIAGTGRNIIVEYEFGMDFAPSPVTDAAIKRLEQTRSENRAAVPGNAVQWTTQDGGVYRLSSPGRRSTGFLDIDAVYLRHGTETPF